jgi:hypothetical protein
MVSGIQDPEKNPNRPSLLTENPGGERGKPDNMLRLKDEKE